MIQYKKLILDNLGYTTLVYSRINKKLKINISNAEIEKLIATIIKETAETNFIKRGKNIYITNEKRNVVLTINSFTYRIITASKLKTNATTNS